MAIIGNIPYFQTNPYDRFERADNSLFYWSNGWCTSSWLVGQEWHPFLDPFSPGRQWQNISPNSEQNATEKVLSSYPQCVDLQQSFINLLVMSPFFVGWTLHTLSFFSKRAGQRPTFGLDFGPYDLDFATRNRARFSQWIGLLGKILTGNHLEFPMK